jgi:gliding motility-associated-like protein
MKLSLSLFRNLICSLALVLVSTCSYANHIVGMDLFYTWMTGNTYKITLVAYGDCGCTGCAFGALPTSSPEVYIYNGGSHIGTISLVIQPPSAGVEVTPVCPADISLTQCTNPSFAIPGIKKFVYSASYTLSGTSPVWRFLFTGQMAGSTVAGRAVSITNISSTPLTYTQLVDTLNNTATHNSSPVLTNIPTPFFCLSNDDNYNPGAVDPDGDSLMFYLVAGQAGTATSTPGGLVTYLPGYSATSPLSVTYMTFDPHTGQISFNPNILQRSLVVYNIEEYHAGAFRGTSQREMTFLVQTCTNTPPYGSISGATAGTIDDGTHFHICKDSGPFSFSIWPSEADTSNNITVGATGLPAGATFSTAGNGTRHPHSTFSWTSTGITPGVYTFYVTYTDNNCPLSGTQTIAYTITIVSNPAVSFTLVSAASCTKQAAISIVPGGGGIPWLVTLSTPGDTVQRFSPVFGTFIDSVIPGTYTLNVFSMATRSCYASTTVSITVPPPINTTPTFTNPTYCGANDGTIKLHHLLPGAVDTIKYTLGGVVHYGGVYTVASDSTITITGLIAGVYTAVTATYGYCPSLPAGPITLSNPPFTIRALSSVNPVWCGICDGSITIYGLHPGQLDTITYTWGGFFQPPVVHFVGPDSTVTITGLCAGVYDHFVAHTAGACVSNMLGPVTLSAPPFTMRSVTFTNPSYCGYCDGTVTLHGLHPGGSDTIGYTRGGFFQPPVAAIVGPDSTITITGLCAGTYDNFVAHAGASCVSNVLGPVTLAVPPFTMRSITFTNPDYCGICNGVITLHGLHPGQLDTLNYTLGGVPQPPVIHLIGTDSLIVITGLCAGTYNNFIAHTAGSCISNTLGPVTLTVPPFTMRTLSFTNPDYCGICNGTITLYGLHPGETDTIRFTKDGIAQPPVVHFIGPDSMVVITGLCNGVYDNFVAHTGGVCVSNTLGPVTLTVPPFLVRGLSHVNPDYCGICNGSITIYGVHPGETDSVTFTIGGVPQPAVVAFVAPDSLINMTGLCAGHYDNIVVRTGGVCVSNTLGPVDLTVPPFTIRSLTHTNVTKCGFCDGSIKIYGAHPGQTDTFTYDFNGVPQTPIVSLIPADSTVTFIALCKGTYSNIVAHTGGICSSNALGPVMITEPPIIANFTYTVSEACAGDTLSCTNLSIPASDLTYTWSFGDGGSSIATNPLHVYYSPGTFTIRLIITNTKCYDSMKQPVTLNNLINAGFTETPDSFLCQGKPVTFTNTTLGTQLKYSWYFGDGTTYNGLDTSHVYVRSGDYKVILAVTNYVPCFDTAILPITVDSNSAISIRATDSVVCNGASVTFTGIYASSGLKGITWAFGDGDSITKFNPIVHSYDKPGYYTVRIEAFYRACPDTSASRGIRVFDAPSLYLGADTSICLGSNAIEIGDINNDLKNARWKWNTGETTPVIKVVAPGAYYAIVRANGGCEATDTIVVANDCYMDIPNAFTPNGDGMNDYFFPRNLLARGLTSFKMDIYNRWGQLIFTTDRTDGRGWDGRFNDVPQPEGVYVYIIDANFKDGQKESKKGNVTLLR